MNELSCVLHGVNVFLKRMSMKPIRCDSYRTAMKCGSA